MPDYLSAFHQTSHRPRTTYCQKHRKAPFSQFLGPYAGHKALHTCTSWHAYAAMFGSPFITGQGHSTTKLHI